MRFIPRVNKDNPYVITFCVSLLLSYLAVSTDNLLNHDAIYFMNSAKIYLRDGLSALIKVFPWPFYSWFVAVIHQVSFFPHIEQTAHVIDALLIAATCVLFIRIYAEITNHEGSLWVAAILILTLTGINKYRADVMKDFGYWLFYLAGFYCLLRYYKKPSWVFAVGWQVFIAIAFLFRIEGIVVMLLGPLALLLKRGSIKERATQVITLYSVYIFVFVLSVLVLFVVDNTYDIVNLTRLKHVLAYLNINGLFRSYNAAVIKLGEIYKYEGNHLDNNAGVLAVIYTASLMAYVVVRVVGCISIPLFVGFLAGVQKRYIALNDANKIIIYFAVFLFLFFFVYMIKGPVLSSRYTTSLVFMLLLLLGQMVERMLPSIRNSRHRKKIVVVVFLYLSISTVDAVISTQGDSKTYVLDAGYWVKENTASTVPVHSNYYKALYYTDRDRSIQNVRDLDTLIKSVRADELSSGVILMLQIDSDDIDLYRLSLEELVAASKIVPLKKFKNDDNDSIAIYQVR